MIKTSKRCARQTWPGPGLAYLNVTSGTKNDIHKDINGLDKLVWKNVEVSLSRRNYTKEGHYAEQSWAPLIQTQLPTYQLEALLKKADGVYMNKISFHGTLLRIPKLFIHNGSDGTSPTELLTESLNDKIELLELDEYKVTVHGKYKGR